MDARAGPGAGVFVYRLQTSKISSPEETPSRFRGRLSLHLCESAVEGIPAAPECGSTGPRGGAVPNQLLRIAVLAGATLAGCGSLYAQGVPGITTKEILIGPCSALEGPSRALGTEQIKGAEAYIHLINQEGGVEGRRLRLLAYDDSYDPLKTEACFKRLASQNVFAMGFFVGTPTAVKYLPMAEEAKIPVVGLFTGAQTLYAPRGAGSSKAVPFTDWNTVH